MHKFLMDLTLLEVHFSAMMWFICCLSKQQLKGIFFFTKIFGQSSDDTNWYIQILLFVVKQGS